MSKWFFLLCVFCISMTGPFLLVAPVSLTVSLAAVFGFIGLALVSHYPLGRVFRPNLWWLSAGLVVLGGGISAFGAVNIPEHLTEVFQAFWVLVVLPCYVSFGARTWPAAALRAFLAGAAFNSFVAVFDYLGGSNVSAVVNNTRITFESAYIPFAQINARNFNYRYEGLMHHSNALTQFSITAFAVSLGLFWYAISNRKKRLSVLALAYVGLHGMAIFAGGSFSGLLGLGLCFSMLAFSLLLPRILRSAYGSLFAFLAAAILAAGFLWFNSSSPKSLQERALQGYDRVTESSGPFRIKAMATALDKISRSPIVGYGMDGESRLYTMGNFPVHNAFLRIWVTGGIFSFLGMLLAYLVGGILGFRYLWSTFRGRVGWLQAALASAFLTNLAITMVQPDSFSFYIWFAAAFLMAFPKPLDDAAQFRL